MNSSVGALGGSVGQSGGAVDVMSANDFFKMSMDQSEVAAQLAHAEADAHNLSGSFGLGLSGSWDGFSPTAAGAKAGGQGKANTISAEELAALRKHLPVSLPTGAAPPASAAQTLSSSTSAAAGADESAVAGASAAGGRSTRPSVRHPWQRSTWT